VGGKRTAEKNWRKRSISSSSYSSRSSRTLNSASGIVLASVRTSSFRSGVSKGVSGGEAAGDGVCGSIAMRGAVGMLLSIGGVAIGLGCTRAGIGSAGAGAVKAPGTVSADGAWRTSSGGAGVDGADAAELSAGVKVADWCGL
jgi:hypothetical protein